MPWHLLDDAPTADVGFVASGPTLAACFQAAADATLAVMLENPDVLVARQRREAHVEDEALDLALLRFLEELIYWKDAESLFLRAAEVDVAERDGRWIVDARLEGEPIDPTRHHVAADPKAVTVHRLAVQRTATGWQATVVLDV
jgi:SHS2 domain-containing protein